jgi:hypothetical protein
MPLIEETLKDTKVQADTFRFIKPVAAQTLYPCHTGKPINRAIEVLSGWKDRSPWRMEN